MSSGLLGVNKIASLLPHSEPMVLLSEVSYWDSKLIRCVALSHMDGFNPLRSGGVPREGFVTITSNLRAHIDRLDLLCFQLEICVRLSECNGDSSSYQFEIEPNGATVIEGELLIVLAQ